MKSLSEIKTIAIAGAGTMGAGIAQVCALSGYDTWLYDVAETALQKGMMLIEKNLSVAIEKGKLSEEEKQKTLLKIKTNTAITDLKCDVLIEAVLEKLEVKQELFRKVIEVNGDDCILATNTSSIPITKIAEGISHPERIVGMHFFNPPHLMKLVEVVSGKETSLKVAQLIFDLSKKLGKHPVMAKDRPGFIVNRIGKLYHTEPIKILEEGIADVETIDALMEASGFKMGPFKLIDLIGVDANLNVTKSLYELMELEEKFKPSITQQKLVDEGKLGKKSGEGFYKYNK
ncbi:hypothetical protein LBMAG27_21340 [Bacteroidota bacterium]|nr:hypothetical protein LBMAG27_21340 [Bacteroidota bacterium]